MPGVRDNGLLASAVEMPRAAMFGQDVYKTLHDKAAAYLYHIVKNHPFNDGNKRTGAGSALIFLRANGVEPKYDSDDYVQLVVSVAGGEIEKTEISQFLYECSQIFVF